MSRETWATAVRVTPDGGTLPMKFTHFHSSEVQARMAAENIVKVGLWVVDTLYPPHRILTINVYKA